MTRLALTNGRLVLPDGIVSGKALIIEDDRVAGIAGIDEVGSDIERLDVEGRYVTPGLVDMHTHGALHRTFLDATEEAFSTILEEQVSRGVTSLLVTTSTAPLETLLDTLELCGRWMKSADEHAGTRVIGAHVEGPYFNAAQAGAQDPTNLRTPDDGSVDQLLEYHDLIEIMTYAPELPGALELTERLVQLGIVPAAGHSEAREEDVAPLIDAGLSHMIHIWSAQSTTIREGPWRKPGLLEVTLAYDTLTAEMITDGCHLPPTLMKLAYKCVGPERLCIISDALSGAGLPDGSTYRMGDMEYEVVDGVGMMFDRSAFAGSAKLLNEMIPILTEQVDVPLHEAIHMASRNPARVIGIDDRKGELAAGKDADVAIYDDDFTAWRTMIAGEWAYVADGE